jgi:hypothetical protein
MDDGMLRLPIHMPLCAAEAALHRGDGKGKRADHVKSVRNLSGIARIITGFPQIVFGFLEYFAAA